MMLLDLLRSILLTMSLACADPRPRAKLQDHAIGLLCGDSPKTITSSLVWRGKVNEDWSADYRLCSQSQWTPGDLFQGVMVRAIPHVPSDASLVICSQDDTLLRKTGRCIPGTSMMRDPLSPPFHVNLVLGQRFLQTSLMIRGVEADRPWRSIPVGFEHCPPLKAPPRATPEIKAAVNAARKRHNLSTMALAEQSRVRHQLKALPENRDRKVLFCVDGSFANRTYLRGTPDAIAVVARIRKNAKLRAPLPKELRRGNRKYAEDLPTPEQVLRDPDIPFQTMTVYISGRRRRICYKTIAPVCWPGVTLDRPIRLIVIRPVGYRLRKGSKLLYREPAYLICTDPEIPVESCIEAYLTRWEAEVNFRDEKTGLGVGQAQVRNPVSVRRTPALLVAAYAALLVASMEAFEDKRTDAFPPLPAWDKNVRLRPSIRDLIAMLRKEVRTQMAA